MSIYKVNDLFYDCQTTGRRDGFNHVVKIKNKFGETLMTSVTKYYNRTWESYNYQVAMNRAQAAFEKKIKRAIDGRVFINYRYEDWSKYDFDVEPCRATLN